MGAKGKFALAYVGASAMLLAGIAIAWVAFWKDLGADEQVAIVPIVMPRAGLFAILIVGSIAFIGFVLRALYRAFVEPPLKLGEEATLLVTANPEHRIKFEGTSEFQPLVKAINALADQRQSLQQDVEQKIVEAKAAVEEEKNRLGALMSELTQSVVVCNLDGRILLYNNRARL